MAIPKGAPHPANAARFMNYVLHPKVQARISKYVSYGTPVSLAKPLLPTRADKGPGDLPARLHQAVDCHHDRPEAREVAGGLQPDRAVA